MPRESGGKSQSARHFVPSGSRVLSVAGAFPRSFPAKTVAIRACGSLAIHGIRVWHTRALENLAGPFRSAHPLAWGGPRQRPDRLAPQRGERPTSAARRVRGRQVELCCHAGEHSLDHGDCEDGGALVGHAGPVRRGSLPTKFSSETVAIRACGSLAIHGIRVWHTRALENLAGPFRSVHPLAWGGGGARGKACGVRGDYRAVPSSPISGPQ